MRHRRSDLALVVARLTVGSQALWLLRRHPKWGDWSLVGGHVEPGEEGDWSRTAAREAEEELAPLRCGIDFVLEPLLAGPTSWGPVQSRSAAGAMTHYRARWYGLRFLGDAIASLRRLPTEDFALVPEAELATGAQASAMARRLLELLGFQTDTIPIAARLPGPDVPLRATRPPAPRHA